MVGVEGFEPPTPCSQSRCATRLRYTPPLLNPPACKPRPKGAEILRTPPRCVNRRARRALPAIHPAGKEKGCRSTLFRTLIGAPGEIRTPDHQVRSLVLYPTELRARETVDSTATLRLNGRARKGRDYSNREARRQLFSCIARRMTRVLAGRCGIACRLLRCKCTSLCRLSARLNTRLNKRIEGLMSTHRGSDSRMRRSEDRARSAKNAPNGSRRNLARRAARASR